jgi:hypothetical protein
MERTNYVNKAKSLILKTARTTALVIMPLAAAVSAHAGSIALPTGNLSCSTSIPSGSCQGGEAQLADLGSGVQGLSFFTSGGFTQGFSISSGTTIMTMMLADFGIVSGGSIPTGTMIPVDWAFSTSASSGATINSWNLAFQLGSGPGFIDDGVVSGGGSGAGFFSGSNTLITTGPILSGSPLYESVLLTLNLNGNFGFIQITVPNGTTFDFQSVAASSVPEPASVGLIGAGLAFFGALLRRRRKQ